MSRVVNAAVIGIAAFILLAGSVWYVSVQNGQEKLDSETVMIVESADANMTRIRATTTFTNRYDVEVQLMSFDYEFKVNGLMLALNRTTEPVTLPPRSEHEEKFLIEFSTEFVSDWMKRHVAEGEESTVAFTGGAEFRVGSKTQELEIEEERPFTTELAEGMSDLSNCPRPAPEPCLSGTRAEWREVNESLVLEVAADIENSANEPVRIDHPTATLRFGNTSIAQAEATGVLLAPEASGSLRFPLFLRHERLTEWWPEHLESCESTPTSLVIRYTYQVEPVANNTTSPTPSTPSAPPTFTPSSDPPTPTSTSDEPEPTTTTPDEPDPTPTTTRTTSQSPTPSSSEPSPTTNTSAPANATEAFASARVTQVFLIQQPSATSSNRTAEWGLGGPRFETDFVCDHADGGGLELPGI